MPAATDLPVSEYAFPGPLRDQLVGAVLNGEKTSTTSLVAAYELEPLPAIGDRAVVIGSAGEPVCIEETTEGEGLLPSPTGVPDTKSSGTVRSSGKRWAMRTSLSTTTLRMCLCTSEPSL